MKKLHAPALSEPERRRRPLQPSLKRMETAPGGAVAARLFAYDFETTRIPEPKRLAGAEVEATPRPLYLTGYGEGFTFAERITSMPHLRTLLRLHWLVPELQGAKFVAWNANNFDAYFVAAALVSDSQFVLRPYLTRGNALRGLRIVLACDAHKRRARGWEFLDGIAMLGLAGKRLEEFLATFAPDWGKLTGTIDFEGGEEFDADNEAHRAYAMRDSVGLWHGMQRAQAILMERFAQPLRATMGAACIRIFKRHIPEGVRVVPLPEELEDVVRTYVLRGGFCYCVERFEGLVWKYDLNQAYAAAMREAALPCGRAWWGAGLHPAARTYVVRVRARKPGNIIPFYYRSLDARGMLRSMFGVEEIGDTWLTDLEHRQLVAEGWQIECRESWWFEDQFSMREYVDTLEAARMTCEGGPSGAVGTMLKGVGNHSYGKTLEELDAVEYLIAAQRPEGFVALYPNDDSGDPLPFLWHRFLPPEEQPKRDYHQPHIGAWITSHVRMVVRRAALIDPAAWLYADTDCVVFSRDVSALLDVHPSRYGAWKVEEAGTPFLVIAKKVYLNVTTGESKAKGLNVKRLEPSDFGAWFDGVPPEQWQTQRNNFLAVLAGAEMYRAQKRRGTAVSVQPQGARAARFVPGNS